MAAPARFAALPRTLHARGLSLHARALRVLGIAENDIQSQASAKIPVRASLTGTVIEKKVTDGQFVQPDVNPLITIADLSSVWVLADVFERDLRFVSVGSRADVLADAYPDEHFSARVSRAAVQRRSTV